MINPGTAPIEQASEDLAAIALEAFLADVRVRAAEKADLTIMTRVAEPSGEPVRDPAADRDGRYGWNLHYTDNHIIRLLIPGVALPLIRDDITASAPCLYVDGHAWWWASAVGMVAGQGLRVKV
ncbi:hypothetical protein [Actinoplanes subglobosus]|uniref:Immunity protein 35 domain-containing protein n=1 Tax=Actinoplanes subglobosus TaxID=1547892 RepID=A0ABV8IRA9_9ACTN